jgi:ribosomal protein S18 acetylase RimI-like enzyme
MNNSLPTYRLATRSDLSAIVALLAEHALGDEGETNTAPLPASYGEAFNAIDSGANNELVVVERGENGLIAVLQLTFIPNIAYRGSWRASIDGVRVARRARSGGIGEQLFMWAIARARSRGCLLLQLTTDKTRPDAIRLYERLGFVASHEGMKLRL